MTAREHPADAELLEYFLAELPEKESDALEDHLFECLACAAALDAIHRTAAGVVTLMRTGALMGTATNAIANRMARDRLNVRSYVMAPGETVACTVAQGDDFLMGRLLLPEGSYERLDLVVLDASGAEMMHVPDVAFDARARQAIIFTPARPAQDDASGLLQYLLVEPSGEGEGTRQGNRGREIARYAMDHTAMRDA